AFAPKIAFEDPLAQLLVHEIEQLDRACMHRDGPRLTTRARHAFDTSILDAAARQLHRQHAPGCASTDDQYGYFSDVRHRRLEISLLAEEGGAQREPDRAKPKWGMLRNTTQNNSFTDICSCRGLNIVLGVPKRGFGTGGPAAGQPPTWPAWMAWLAASLYCRGCCPPQRLYVP